MTDYVAEHFKSHPLKSHERVRPTLVCKDGTEISIQSSPNHYCTEGMSVECMFDYRPRGLRRYLRGGVWSYVPIYEVNRLIRRHGGNAK